MLVTSFFSFSQSFPKPSSLGSLGLCAYELNMTVMFGIVFETVDRMAWGVCVVVVDNMHLLFVFS